MGQGGGSVREKLDVEVYRTATEIVILGIPEEDDETHNCDAMGCARDHVLYRFPLPKAVQP